MSASGDDSHQVTQLLNRLAAAGRTTQYSRDGQGSSADGTAADDTEALFQLVYRHLRVIAESRMRSERVDHTLQPTALVNEAYLRLLESSSVTWENRTHFYCAAAEAMRRILIEHARSRGRQKRSGNRRRIPLDLVELAEETNFEDVLALDDAVQRIEAEEPDVAQVVRLRFYAGLSIDETAQALQLGARTVDRLWTYARMRLFRMMNESE